MKRILILILVFVTTASFPCIALASDAQPSENDYMINLEPSAAINYILFKEDYTKLIDRYINFGKSQYISSSFGSLAMVSIEYDFTETLRPYFGLMSTSSNVWFKFDAEFVQFTDPSPLADSMKIYTNYDVGNGFVQYTVMGNSDINNGNNVLNSPAYSLGNQFLNSDTLSYLTIQQRIDIDTNPDRLYDYEFIAQSFSLIVYIEGVSGSDVGLYLVIDGGFKDINDSLTDLKSEVNAMQGQLGNIDNSINQGFDNLGNQIGGVQDDINSGFNEVGGKLDSMLTPDSNNQQAVDQMGGQVDSNKQEAEDIKNQIDSLDKPDPDDLIDQIDPDQFIDNDDEAVQEMTGILASVTGSKVVKNYLLLLICVGIVSFVVYGKKGG